MKRILLLSLTVCLLFASCSPTPEASFAISVDTPTIGENIVFFNYSIDGDNYEWDFGDGTVSYDAEPIHHYNVAGSYDVTLTVYTEDGKSDQVYMTIDVVVPTLLAIDVVLYPQEGDTEYLYITDARVRLYRSTADWDAETNMVIEGYTDRYGTVVFSHLPDIEYYVDIQHENYNNVLLANESTDNIYISGIAPNFINYYTFYVDQISKGVEPRHANDIATSSRALKVNSSDTYSGNITFDELYKRSIKYTDN